jgi:outer membrane immunogenic protein
MWRLARSTALVLLAVGVQAAGSPSTFAQSNDELLRRLEAKIDALAKENAALRERVRRLEKARTEPVKAEASQATATKTETTVAGPPAPAAAMEAQARAVTGVGAARASRWTGLYVGGTGGFGWGNPTTSTSNDGTATANGTSVFVPLNPGEYPTKTTGWTVGALAGYSHQLNNRVVLGLEGDFSWANIDGAIQKTAICSGFGIGSPVPNCSYEQSQKLQWLATLRGRLGFSIIPDTVIYGTAGLAAGRVRFSHAVHTTGFVGTFDAAASGAKTKTGWVIGTGIESWIAPNWIVRLEYLHYDLGTISSTAPILAPGPTGRSTRADFRAYGDVARGSLIYKFD